MLQDTLNVTKSNSVVSLKELLTLPGLILSVISGDMDITLCSQLCSGKFRHLRLCFTD